MSQKVLFESKVDDKYRFGYIPFSMVCIMLILIGIFYFAKVNFPFLYEYVFEFIFFIVLLEIVLIKSLSPKKKLQVKKNESLFYLKIINGKNDSELVLITGFDFWWNYNFKKNSFNSYDWGSGGNSGLSGRGEENRLNLHVVFYGKNGVVQTLTENLLVWESFPIGWNYKLKNNPHDVLILWDLKKLVKSLLEEGFPKFENRNPAANKP